MLFLTATDTIVSILLAVTLGAFLGLLISKRKKYDYSTVMEIEADKFRENMRKGQLIDIRLEEEFNKKRINGSRNFPKNSVFKNESLVRKDLSVFLYDDNGSKKVTKLAKKLTRKGYVQVYILKGGFAAWPYNKK